ncbi:MAG: hypothetical protein AMXMBFR7_26390 [Planctomycetota bacterium]
MCAEAVEVIVVMHGGVVDRVVHNNPKVAIGRVIVLEDPKYLSGEIEEEVAKGQFKGLAVYSEHESELESEKALEPVIEAADRRIANA